MYSTGQFKMTDIEPVLAFEMQGGGDGIDGGVNYRSWLAISGCTVLLYQSY